MKERIYKFDTLKVICMMMVVLAHTLTNSYGCKEHEMIRFLLLCFTMPLFMFIRGYLSKPESSFPKSFRYLLVPFIVFTFVYDGIQYLVNPSYVFSWKTPGFAMWYLWTLFIYRVSLRYLIKIPYVLVLSFVLSWVVGFFPQIGGDFGLCRLFCFLPFYLLGYKIANERIFETIRLRLLNSGGGGGKILLLVLIFGIWEIFIYFCPGHTYATGFYNGYGLSLMGCLMRIALQATIIMTGALVLLVCPNKEYSITKYGKRTMCVYLLHPLIILPFAYVVSPKLQDANILQAIAMMCIPTFLCIGLFNKYIDNIVMKICK